jgi:hypothetical protein
MKKQLKIVFMALIATAVITGGLYLILKYIPRQGDDVSENIPTISEPVGMAYRGQQFNYEIKTKGGTINITEFYNKKSEHCMLATHKIASPPTLICENH